MQKDLVDFLLADLRPRPGMYLTAYSLQKLDIYLTGVQVTCGQLDETGEYSERFFGDTGFLRWSWQKYKLENPSCRLVHYLDLAGEDDQQALDMFFQDLEVFRSQFA